MQTKVAFEEGIGWLSQFTINLRCIAGWLVL